MRAKKVQDLNKNRLVLFLTIVFASMMVTRVGAQQATIRVVPASSTVQNVGLTLSVNVTVENAENLFAWAFKLYYPNDILNGTDAAQGPFLKTDGNQPAFIVFNFTDGYNATYGFLDVLCTRTGNVSGLSGNGTLATITFKSVSIDGPKTLHLADAKLSDPDLNPISSTTADSEVTVIPEYTAPLILLLLTASTLVAVTLGKKQLTIEDYSTSAK